MPFFGNPIFLYKTLIVFFLITVSIAFNNSYAEDGPYAEWKPPFLPIVITVDGEGIQVAGEASIATPVGTFSVGYSHDLLKEEHKNLVLVIKDKQKEHVYEIDSDKKLFVFVNGTTLIEAKNNVVIVDATKSKKIKIQFSTQDNPFEANKDNIVPISFNVLTREKTGDRFTKLHDGDTIKAGSRMKINFQVDEKAYVYIYHVKSTGLSQRIFPASEVRSNSLIIGNPIAGGKTVYFPANQESYVIENEVSNDDIYFIALNKKDAELERASTKVKDYISSNYAFDFNTISFTNR